jgi:hypothetical protein
MAISPDRVRTLLRELVDEVDARDDFLRRRLALDPTALVEEPIRRRLDALPGMVRVRGDAAPVEYELQNGEGVARVHLREGQAKRLRADEVPPLDRPIRFAVQRGRHAPILADTVSDLQALLRRPPKPSTGEDGGPGGRRGNRRPRRKRGPGHRR